MNIQLSNISKSYSDMEVLKNINFTINDNERIGLIGKNGSGKSTLLKIITGLVKPDVGTVNISPPETTIGFVPQSPEFNPEISVEEFLSEMLSENWEGYKIDLALQALVITDVKNIKLKNLSSGQKTKVYLARLILNDPEVLLLDEPTNHLDTNSLEWFEKYIKKYQGAVMIISHDRKFLDNSVNSILALESGNLKDYGGNYSFYRQQSQNERDAQLRKYEVQQKTHNRLREQVRIMKTQSRQLEVKTSGKDHYVRKKAAKAAKSAKSIEKRLERELEKNAIEKPESDFQLKALFKPIKESSKTVVHLKSVSKNFNSQPILSNVSLTIQKGDRLAILGSNGSGKSTLLKIILDELKPTDGLVGLGNNVITGYLSQGHNELDSKDQMLDELLKNTHLNKTDAYKLLVRFLIPVEKINQSVNSLSSGEKAKLLLAEIMASGANFIILDEPTNHLDISSREALEHAIINYEGTLLVVSHDRYFIENININRRFLLAEGKLRQV